MEENWAVGACIHVMATEYLPTGKKAYDISKTDWKCSSNSKYIFDLQKEGYNKDLVNALHYLLRTKPKDRFDKRELVKKIGKFKERRPSGLTPLKS